jgi:hypothetical protein
MSLLPHRDYGLTFFAHLLHLSAYGDALESRLVVSKSLILPYTPVCVACVITCECNAYVQAVPA